MDAPTNTWQAIAQARDLASWDERPNHREALERLSTIFMMLEPWEARERKDIEPLQRELELLRQEVAELERDLTLWRRRYRSLRGSAEKVATAKSNKLEHEAERLRLHLARLAKVDRLP